MKCVCFFACRVQYGYCLYTVPEKQQLPNACKYHVPITHRRSAHTITMYVYDTVMETATTLRVSVRRQISVTLGSKKTKTCVQMVNAMHKRALLCCISHDTLQHNITHCNTNQHATAHCTALRHRWGMLCTGALSNTLWVM